MVDVFKEYAKAEMDLMDNQADELIDIFEKAHQKASKAIRAAKVIDGGKNIRIPLEYVEEE